jgi:hypothetical protein
MTRRYIIDDKSGELVEITDQHQFQLHGIIPDIDPFRSPDGVYINSRKQWRDHLKRTDCIELGHSDIASMKVAWNKRQANHAERIGKSVGVVSEHHGDISCDNRPQESTRRLQSELANRLYGRNAPSRKALIKLALEIRGGR